MMSRRFGSSKPTPTPLYGLAVTPGKREEKSLKETQILQYGKPPIKTLPRTAGVAGGEQNGKGTKAKQTTEERVTARKTIAEVWIGSPL